MARFKLNTAVFHLFPRQTKQAFYPGYQNHHQKLHTGKNCWDFLDFYRNAALIKYFANNQYYVTYLIIQRINGDFKYVILHCEKPGIE